MVSATAVSAPTYTRAFSDEELYDLRPHQVKALNKLGNGKILWGGVGTGKSRVAAAYYAKNEAPRDVIVITTAKKRDSFDWREEFYRIGIGPATGPDTGNLVGRSVKGGKTVQGNRNTKRGSDHQTPLRELSRVREALSLGDHDESSGSSRVVLDEDGSRRSRAERDGGDVLGSSGQYPWVLTVDSWNNIAKYANVAGAFFIFDEQRLVGSGDWTRKFLRIAKNNRWILLSGTPGDTWMDYIPVFVANNFYKNRTAFKREHVVYNSFTKFPKVDRYINVGKLVRLRSQLLVEMPYERHTKRHVIEVPLEYDKEALEMVLKKRWNIYENRPLRDVAEMFSVGRRLVNSDPSRLEMVKELWQKHPKLIIFYNFNYELEILRTLAQNFGNYTSQTTHSGKKHSNEDLSTSHTSDKLKMSSPVKSTPDLLHHSLSMSLGSRESFKDTKTSALELPKRNQRSALTESVVSQKLNTRPSSSVSTSMENSGAHGLALTPAMTDSSSESPKDTETHTMSISGSVAEWNGHKHQPIPVGDRWIYLVQYTAGAEGWNCVETDAMIMHSRNYSWKVLEQSFGRIDRLNTPFNDLWYYDLMSDSFIDKAIGRALKAKETFNEAKYAQLLPKNDRNLIMQ